MGTPNAQLAAGFGIGVATAHRYVTETLKVLTALAPALKPWRLLRKLRCSTTRITTLVRAVLASHLNASP